MTISTVSNLEYSVKYRHLKSGILPFWKENSMLRTCLPSWSQFELRLVLCGHSLRGVSASPKESNFFVSRSNTRKSLSRTSFFVPRVARRCFKGLAMATGLDYSCAKSTKRVSDVLIKESGPDTIKLEFIQSAQFESWKTSLPTKECAWIEASSFEGKDGELIILPADDWSIDRVAVIIDDVCDIWAYAALPSKLPKGIYEATTMPTGETKSTMAPENSLALGWILGTYEFKRYKSTQGNVSKRAALIWPANCDENAILATAEGIFLARDMITTPAEDMGPQHIEQEARSIASMHGASIETIVGDDLLEKNYPAIHTVGRASDNDPRLIDIRWSPSSKSGLPRITLVGKGVAFDTGGLDLKPANAMKLMKKDMGGAALVLGLAHAIMKTQIPVQLRVLVPAVENSVSGNAFRPLDVLQTRAGITVENGNTDAEGRLILCDALAEAVTEKPELLIDAATLTGAARVALGTEMPALFCSDDTVADNIIACATDVSDHMWRMPLHKPYRKMLNSKVADIASCSEGGYAGAITAALFLQEFVKDAPAWVHIDTMGYNLSSKPGRPEGGEALALRALYEYLRKSYAA